MFSPTFICANSPSRLRSSVTSATPAARASARMAKRDRLAVEHDPALRRLGCCAEQAFQQFGAAGAHQAGDAEDFAASQREAEMSFSRQPRACPGQGSDRFSTSSTHFAGLALAAESRSASISRPTIRCVTSAASVSLRSSVFDQPAVAQHGDAVGQAKHLVHLVRDVEDRHAALAQPLDHAKQPGDLGFGERAGRLVHDQDVGFERQGLGDLDQLLIADAQRADRLPRIDRGIPAVRAAPAAARPSRARRASPSAVRSSRPRKMLAAAESCSTRFSS